MKYGTRLARRRFERPEGVLASQPHVSHVGKGGHMKAAFRIGLVVACVALSAAWAQAQTKGAAEIGFDFGINYGITDSRDTPFGPVDNENITSVGVPASDFGAFLQNVRVGCYVTKTSEIETAFGLSLVDAGGESFWQLGLGVDYMHNFASHGSRPFVRLGPTVSVLHSGDVTDSQFGVGAGGGVRSPIADRLDLRFEAGFNRVFETDERLGRWDLLFSIGLSFFSK